MKVLVLSQHYWPESFRITEVVECLRRAGCSVTVLTGQPNYPGGEVFDGYRAGSLGSERHPTGYTIHRVPLSPRGNGTALRLVVNYVSFLLSATLLGPWALRHESFDVIFVYGTSPILQAIPAILLKRIKRAALVTWVQDLWPQSLEVTGFVRNRRLLDAVAQVVSWIYRRNDLLLVQSRAFVPTVQAMSGSTTVEYHPNPSELSLSIPVRSDEVPALVLEDGFNVVFAGNLGTVQALDTLLSAAERLRAYRDIRLVLIGSGSRSEWCHQEVVRRGLQNVRLPGRFEPADMPAILAQASALLVSLVHSPIMSQTVPSKIQAYLATGRPVVASMDGEGAEIVKLAGAGIACPAEDVEALAEAILSLRNMSPEARLKMGESGHRYFQQHFDPEVLAARLVERLKKLISAG